MGVALDQQDPTFLKQKTIYIAQVALLPQNLSKN